MTDGTEKGDGPAGLPETYRGWFSRRRRGLVWLLLACFAVALAWPFYRVPRLRYVFHAVPRIPSRSLEAIRPVTAKLSAAEAVVQREVRRQGMPGAALAIGVRDTALLQVGFGRTMWG
ncbi:MAG TPA: hypothetical protein VEX86_12495, partial [Longimicrobium sp.]|nr:hypothetical protein [Longimicrobium sp.]